MGKHLHYCSLKLLLNNTSCPETTDPFSPKRSVSAGDKIKNIAWMKTRGRAAAVVKGAHSRGNCLPHSRAPGRRRGPAPEFHRTKQSGKCHLDSSHGCFSFHHQHENKALTQDGKNNVWAYDSSCKASTAAPWAARGRQRSC